MRMKNLIPSFYLILSVVILCAAYPSHAQDSVSTLSDSSAKIARWRLWGELYDESMFFLRDRNNLNSISHIRQGLKFRFTDALSLESYFLLRYGKDLHRDYWNNKFETGLGIRLRFSKKIFLAYYLEAIRGSYTNVPEFYPQPDDKQYNDFRTGLIFWYGWDKYYSTDGLTSFPLSMWGEAYGDVTYYQYDHRNFIGYLHVKSGFHLFQFWKTVIDGYGVVYLLKDRNKDFWNNVAEFGPGVWFKPWPDLDLKFFAEWLWVRYFGIEGEDVNPYSQSYRDRRVGVLFWIGW